jgi:hypothetical protein
MDGTRPDKWHDIVRERREGGNGDVGAGEGEVGHQEVEAGHQEVENGHQEVEKASGT